MGLGLLDLSTVQVGTGYPAMALAVAVMGAGMGLVMAPASSTIMTTVPAHQAGAGSAVNDTIREVGGALGVAIVGSLTAAIYRSRLTGKPRSPPRPRWPAAHRERLARRRRCRRQAPRRPARQRDPAGGAGQFHYRDGPRHAGRRPWIAIVAAFAAFALIPRTRRPTRACRPVPSRSRAGRRGRARLSSSPGAKALGGPTASAASRPD